MTSSSEQKMEKLWQKFERTGSIQAYLRYQALKNALPAKGKMEGRKSKTLAKAGR